MKNKWTLYQKIRLVLAGVLGIIFIAAHFVLLNLLETNITSETEAKAIGTATMLQQNLEVLFDDAHDSLGFLNTVYYDQARADDVIRNDLKRLTQIKESIRNAFVIYNDGDFVLEPYVEIPEDYDPRINDYYISAYNSRTVQWSEPYIDMATHELVITGSSYIQFQETDGVIGVDINLKDIPVILRGSNLSENGYTMLVSDKDWIIIDSAMEHINEPLEAIEDRELSESKIFTGVLETSKGKYFIRNIKNSHMRLISFLPHEAINRRVVRTSFYFSLVMIIAFIFGNIITHYLIKRLMNPIEQLRETMKASESSDNLIMLNIETTDEINTLIKGYNRLAENVNQQNEELIELSNNLMNSEKELQKQYNKVSELAFNDYLTGLPNRVKFEDTAKMNINNKVAFALFYIDLDNFKYINDTYGHSYGDIVLQIIAMRFKNCCDKDFFGARLSGDEFGMLVYDTDLNELNHIAKGLLKVANEPIFHKDIEFTVTCSIGISVYPEDGLTYEDILSNADIAMYQAKDESKNTYLIFSQELRDDMINRIKIENKLLSAVEDGSIEVYYQPLINFSDKTVKGFEALARWNSPELGFISPNIFIPIAEKNLTINKIGAYVLEEAIKFGVELFDLYDQYYEMNVNVSVVQLHLETLPATVEALLKKYNYPAQYLNLEITESLALESNKKIKERLDMIRQLGVALSLDDFGSGYSSLNHLLNIDLTHLKIDRSIITEASKDKTVYKLIRGIVEFAHAIGLKVVAEGIEDVYMEEMMQKMTIDFAQGYLYSKPISKSHIIEFISQKHE